MTPRSPPPARGREDRQRSGGGPGRGRAPHRLAGRRRRRHRRAARPRRRGDRRLLRRHRAGAPHPRPARSGGCGWRSSRPPPRSARSAWRRPGARRCPPSGLTAAQLLLTLDDTEDRRRYLNARATLNTLLGLGCIPVINENDTVATAEIRFGDNDRLAARVAEMIAGRPAGAAVRHRRPLHRRPAPRSRRRAHPGGAGR